MKRLLQMSARVTKLRMVRVLFVGGIGFIVQTIIFELLSTHTNLLPPSTAVLVGGEVAILSNFYLNNRFSFTDRLALAAPLWTRLARFHLVVSGSLFTQWVFLFITERFTENIFVIHSAYVAGVVVGFISNYIGYHFWVWKHHTHETR